MTTRYYLDLEFLEDGRTIELISIGIVSSDGREYYAVSSDAPMGDIKQNDWLMRNVMPSLPLVNRQSLDSYVAQPPKHFPRPSVEFLDLDRKITCVRPRWVIANEVRDFLLVNDGDRELWAAYGAYDHVGLCQLWGKMIDLPDGVPMWTNDIQQEWVRLGKPDMPQQESGEHNALADARHVKVQHEFLMSLANEDGPLAEARSWARHGYEIGQRSCTWSDHGVAPKWLTEGWPKHFGKTPDEDVP